MKKKELISKKYKNFFFDKINFIIESKFFKPLSLTIIAVFIFFKIYQYLGFFLTSKFFSESQNKISNSIKISLAGTPFNLDFEEEQVLDYQIKNGDTLLKILADVGAEDQDVFSIIGALKKIKSSQNLSIGSQITITYRSIDDEESSDQNAKRKVVISNVTIPQSVEENIVITRKNDGSYDARELKVKLLRYNSRYFGVIKNGLYIDGVEAGISPNAMMNMITLYGYDIDFQRDIHSGDKFEMLVESFYDENGKKVRDGNVLFSSLTLQNRKIEIYMHKITDGDKTRVEYFDVKGNSIKKSLLRTPINGARVSSGFGMRRHPILGYSKMHKGVDFAAPIGTPILAAGSGTIVYMSPKGGYGNYVQIKHNPDYSTAYGHASRFSKRFRVGSKVKQGDVVAYVGNTGRSTGPHLHFELIYRGSQVNPSKVKATSGIKLVGKELVRFEASKNEIDRYRKNTPNQFKNAVN
ncbi:MAG: M23 family peptidase [Alphaproteobacteria bacterium]|nr:M23 family peptidase [Alphaproteobacteria bacterium]